MRRLPAFLKATTLGGLFAVLPIVVVFALLTKAVLGMRATVQALMEKLAGQGSNAAQFPILFALLLLVAISFALGLLMISRHGQAAGRWLERMLLVPLPGYAAVRAIVGGLSDASREGVVKPGLLTVRPGVECFVLVIEDHGDEDLTIFIPGSPNPGSGSVQIVRKDFVRMLNVRITDIGGALQQWGMGSSKVLAKDSVATPIEPAPLQS